MMPIAGDNPSPPSRWPTKILDRQKDSNRQINTIRYMIEQSIVKLYLLQRPI